MKELPKGWSSATIADVTQDILNVHPEQDPTNEFGYVDISSIDNSTYSIADVKKIKGANAPSRAKRPVRAGDVLFSNVRTYLRNIALVPEGSEAQICSTGFTVLRSNGAVDPLYLFRWVLTDAFIEGVTPRQTGTHYPATSDRVIRSEVILLPPINEQRRIVAKLEQLLSRVDAAQARLATIPHILKRFRQSVLAAACSGKLTVDWREGRGQDTSNGFPPEWSSSTLGRIADIVDPNPSHRYPSYEDGSVPILSTQEFSGLNDWDTSSAKLVPTSFFDERSRANGFFEDDIVFARKGRLGLARRPPKIPRYTFSHTIFLVRANGKVISDFLLWYLRQETCVTWLLHEMNSNTGVPTLGKAFLSQLPVAVPPTEEQQEIVRRVEALFNTADALEARYGKAQAHVDKLTQSILAKAFRGELVLQDPTDEPAQLLVKRITNYREQVIK